MRRVCEVFALISVLAVSMLACDELFGQSVTLSWDANSETDLAGYNIYRCGPLSAVQTICPRSGALIFNKLNTTLLPVAVSPSYLNSGLAYGQKFAYVVTAVNTSARESGYSNEVVTTILNPNAPAPPANFRVTAGGTTAYLQWEAIDGATRYEVWARPIRRIDGDWVQLSQWTKAVETPVHFYTFNRFTRPAAFKVRAIVGDLVTPFSDFEIYEPSN